MDNQTAAATLTVVVCFATPTDQRLVTLPVADGTTLEQAARAAFPDLDVMQYRVGIFGKLKTLDTVLRDHDRVEIYRPLLADPKESRRRRAGKKD
jgi:putative ubiquitin-RnfH superfamily antitoxin RatB of RatAB toxin-antitoxin module